MAVRHMVWCERVCMRIFVSAALLGRGKSLRQWAVVICGCSIFITANAESVHAQGFFQTLFGGGAKKSAPRPVYSNRRVMGNQPVGATTRQKFRYPLPRNSYSSIDRPRPEARRVRRRQSRVGSGSYRTMCVRSCDGYYFPISFNVSRSRFGKDAEICRLKCGGQAQLYYMPSRSSPKTMVDMHGKRYAKTETAFLFRKKRIQSCRCRPEAWSSSEKFRHKLYELNEPKERKLAREEGDLEFLAGITKVRKSVLRASRAAKAAKIARQKAAERAVQLAILKRLNQARALSHAQDRKILANAGQVSRRKQPRYVQISRQVAAEQLGQPSFYSNFSDATRPLNAERRRRKRAFINNGSYSYVNHTPRRRRYARRLKPLRYVSRRRTPRRSTAAKSNGWSFGGKPKYRWPGD